MNKDPFRILIVDDDEDIRVNLGDILTDRGFDIDTAADGEIALNKISTSNPSGKADELGQFDLCLLDFKMPGMSGAELFQKIRNRCPHIRAIMITAYAGDDGIQQAREAGTWKVLSKPVDVESLLQLIVQATET